MEYTNLLDYITLVLSLIIFEPHTLSGIKRIKLPIVFALFGLQFYFFLKFADYLLLTFLFDISPMRLNENRIVIEKLIFLFVYFSTASGISALLHKKFKIMNYLQTNKLLNCLLIVIGISTTYSVCLDYYCRLQFYPISLLTFNFAYFSLILSIDLIFIICIYHTDKKKCETEKRWMEYEELQSYIHHLETWENNIHIFRHDFSNILLSLYTSVDKKNWNELKEICHFSLLPFCKKYLLNEKDENS